MIWFRSNVIVNIIFEIWTSPKVSDFARNIFHRVFAPLYITATNIRHWLNVICKLRYIWRWISRKPLEIEAWFQRTTNIYEFNSQKMEMTYGESNGHVTDDVTWPQRWGSTVGYPSDNLASCHIMTHCAVICLCTVTVCLRVFQ